MNLIRTLAVFGAFALAAPVALAQPKMTDAVLAGEVVTLTATIVSVDPTTRTVVVKGPMGRSVALKAGDKVRNFAQIKAGDTVVLKYTEAVAVSLRKGGEAGRSATVTTQSASAPAGEKPAGSVVRTTKIVANVERVDAAKSQVLLQGPEGRYVEVKVRDPNVMKEVKAGDKVEVDYVEAVVVEDIGPAKK